MRRRKIKSINNPGKCWNCEVTKQDVNGVCKNCGACGKVRSGKDAAAGSD